MSHVVVRSVPKAPLELVDRLAASGTATVHEAQGRTGYLGPGLRPAYPHARVGGTAVTVLAGPGDNLMAHVAVEVTGPGDVLVVALTAPSTDGYFGELLATSLMARGVRGLVTETGVRDVAELERIGFPTWSRAVSAQGTTKAAPGSVNVPVTISGVVINPGDVVVGDDDGVVVVARERAAEVADAAEARTDKEDKTRADLASGTLGLDIYDLRGVAARLGVTYVDHADGQ